MFDSHATTLYPNQVVNYSLTRSGEVLSYATVLDLWRTDEGFRDFFSSLLSASSFAAFRWETPPLTNATATRPFEFVLVNTPNFVNRRSDRQSYASYFTDAPTDGGVVAFQNLSGDATLVVPSPRGADSNYGHLAAFVRGAPRHQVNALWSVLARTVAPLTSDKPRWISTAGGGVAWLHVRIDTRPKYYSYAGYKFTG